MKFRRQSAKWALALPPKTAAKSDRRGGPRCRLRSAVRNARARPEAPAGVVEELAFTGLSRSPRAERARGELSTAGEATKRPAV